MFSHTTKQKLEEIRKNFSSVAQEIFLKNHLQPFSGQRKVNLHQLPVERISYGAQHASRVAIYIPILVNYFRTIGYPEELICLTNEEITMLQLAALYQDVARKSDREGGQEKQSADRFKQFLISQDITDSAALDFCSYIYNDKKDCLNDLLQAAASLDMMRVRHHLQLNEIRLYEKIRSQDKSSFLKLAKAIRNYIAEQHDLKYSCKIMEGKKTIYEAIAATRNADQPQLKQDYEQARCVYK